MSEQTPEPTGDTQEQTPEQAGQEQLQEAGKAALNAEREARRAADKRSKDLERELNKLRTAGMSENEKAVAEAEKRGRAEAMTEVGQRLARTEFAAAVARRNPEFKAEDVLEYLNLGSFVGEDGEPDLKAITQAVERLVPTGTSTSMDLGDTRGMPPQQGQSDMSRLIRKAAGRT